MADVVVQQAIGMHKVEGGGADFLCLCSSSLSSTAAAQGGGEAKEQHEIHQDKEEEDEEEENEEDSEEEDLEEDSEEEDSEEDSEEEDSEEEHAEAQEEVAEMHRDLLRAATSGDYSESMKEMTSEDPSILLGTTPSGNTCLHISSIHGHQEFCQEVITLEQSLLTKTNLDGETPLVVAVTLGHTSLASLLLGRCLELRLRQAILQQDRDGFNALHHAIRNGHQDLALKLIEVEPALSEGVSKCNQSPMFIAVMKDFTQIFEALLEIPNSAHAGQHRRNVLHVAATNENSVVATKIMERRPFLAKETDTEGYTPTGMAVIYNKVFVLRVLLKHNSSFGYKVGRNGYPLLCSAALRGHVGVARELLKHCLDARYRCVNNPKSTCLHIAVQNGHLEFVEFILTTPQFQKLINMQDNQGKTALHYAIEKSNPRLVVALLSHKNTDTKMLDKYGNSVALQLRWAAEKDKNPDWEKVQVLMWKSNTSSSPGGMINRRLMEAATSGDSGEMRAVVQDSGDPISILLGATSSGNTCLHIASMHGHQEFCEDVLDLEEHSLSLLTAVNSDKETPLVAAVRSGHVSLASVLLQRWQSIRQELVGELLAQIEAGANSGCACDATHRTHQERVLELSDAILKQDKNGCNALHHAIRSGHEELAMELIAAEPALSKVVNKYNESPMYIAVMRNFTHVFEELLEIPDSSHEGRNGYNALHAAVENADKESSIKIMLMRPEMARATEKVKHNTPTRLAVLYNNTDMLRVLLEHDSSLGYEVCKGGYPLLNAAAFRGHVEVAREILNKCPDAPYCQVEGKRWTCLHTAVIGDHTEFIEFILTTPHLRGLVNMETSTGETALHFAVQRCNPKTVTALLSHEDIDPTIADDNARQASWSLPQATNQAKTLNWNEVSMLMLRAVPQQATSVYNLHKYTKQRVTDASRKDAKSLTQRYTSNTSLVAILTTTITFAAAFTLPGGYSDDVGNEGLPIMSKKFAFQAFLISDVLAMCSSFAVAFICIIARWEDYEFLIYYRSFTKKLMWFAYLATTTAFSTGLYTVLTPHLHRLAIAICVLVALLPILTKLLGEWPVLKLRFRLGKTFNSDLLDMV